jgi:hypothetical protein
MFDSSSGEWGALSSLIKKAWYRLGSLGLAQALYMISWEAIKHPDQWGLKKA